MFGTPKRRLVRFHLLTDATIEGFNHGIADGHYISTKARLMDGAEVEELAGRIRIPKDRVHFIQEVG